MKAPRSRIAKVIAERTLRGKSVPGQLSREVAAYLLDERRVHDLDSIMRDVQSDWADDGYVEVLAYSAHPLTAAVKDDIAQEIRRVRPDARQIVVTEVIDLSVIGGVNLRLANQQLDLSVEAKLHRFKQLTSAGKE